MNTFLAKTLSKNALLSLKAKKNEGFQLSPAPKEQPVDDDEKMQTPNIDNIHRHKKAIEEQETTDEEE
jgi:hypothetical protein